MTAPDEKRRPSTGGIAVKLKHFAFRSARRSLWGQRHFRASGNPVLRSACCVGV